MVLGLDLSRRDVACVLAKDNGEVVLALRAALPDNADSLQQWRALVETAQETIIRSMQAREHINTAVLAMDARIDANGRIEKTSGSEGWHHLDLEAGLRENLQLENAQVFNRIVCEGVGEMRFGALQHTSSTRCLYVHIGSSLGAAFCENESWRFIDIGEIVVERDGSMGSCGRRGTLEAYCNEENFLARAASYGVTLRNEHEVWEMAQSSFAAQSLRDDFVRRLCHGLAIVWTLLQPDIIVLGGSLAISLGEELLQSVRRGIHEFCALKDEMVIINGTLKQDAAVLGAVAMGSER